ncbi:MAG: hypothetical protein JWL59_4323 [Chthoniobacteraceae bacterium]|nr:hypothetical protein [Chthoniobacteraceae bacterium]
MSLPSWLNLTQIALEFQHWFLSFDKDFRPVLTAIVTGGLGFLGALLAAGVALLILKKNLAFSTMKHREDVEMALRKEIYANASDIFSEAIFVLPVMLFPKEETDLNAAAFLPKLAGSIGKIQIVATPATLASVFKLQRSFQDSYEKFKHWNHIIKRHDIALNAIKGKIDYLIDEDLESDRESKNKKNSLTLEHGLVSSDKANDMLSAFEHTIDLTGELSRLRIDVIVAFRKELRIPVDETWFRSEVEKGFKLTYAQNSQAVKEVRRHIVELKKHVTELNSEKA